MYQLRDPSCLRVFVFQICERSELPCALAVNSRRAKRANMSEANFYSIRKFFTGLVKATLVA